MSSSFTKQLGCIMIFTGTEIGAGILALPIITAKLGFIISSIIMLSVWAVMTYTNFLIADISLSMPRGSSFVSISRKYLGLVGSCITWIVFLILMYCISIAYISAASSAFFSLFPFISQTFWAVIFVTFLGFIIITGIIIVDLINRILLAIKLFFLILVCLIFCKDISLQNLLVIPIDLKETLCIAIPIITTSFTAHVIVPSLTEYLNKDAKMLFNVILYGSIIPLILYVFWLSSILGVLPLDGPVSFMESIFNNVDIKSANIGNVLDLLKEKKDTTIAQMSVNIFTDISVMTSYLGVGLALYHFNVDSYRLNRLSKKNSILIGIILTFFIPLLINTFNNNLFITAIGYVGICVAILLLIIPSLIAFVLFKEKYQFHYKINNFPILWIISLLTGISIIIIHFINDF